MTMAPMMSLQALALVMKGSRAVILAGYGMGNLPSNNLELMQTIREAVASGVIVVIKT